jgi:hypothetical protein
MWKQNVGVRRIFNKRRSWRRSSSIKCYDSRRSFSHAIHKRDSRKLRYFVQGWSWNDTWLVVLTSPRFRATWSRFVAFWIIGVRWFIINATLRPIHLSICLATRITERSPTIARESTSRLSRMRCERENRIATSSSHSRKLGKCSRNSTYLIISRSIRAFGLWFVAIGRDHFWEWREMILDATIASSDRGTIIKATRRCQRCINFSSLFPLAARRTIQRIQRICANLCRIAYYKYAILEKIRDCPRMRDRRSTSDHKHKRYARINAEINPDTRING